MSDTLHHQSTDDVFVDWDQSCVMRSTDPRPYTTNLSCCIAILMRAFDASNPSYPMYLSVTHVFTQIGLQKFKDSLQEVIKKTRRGAIEIFLCGGFNRLQVDRELTLPDLVHWFSNKMHDEIRLEAAREHIPIVQDLVGLAHASGWQEEGVGEYQVAFGIGRTGFDAGCNPYAVVAVESTYFTGQWTPGSWWVN